MKSESIFIIGMLPSLILLSSIAFSAVVEIIIEYEPGPSLLVEIVNYPSSAQPSSSISLTSKVTNVGTENATNVWLAWSLPSDWTITSGSLNVSIGTLEPNEVGWNNITVTTGELTGTYTITALSNSSEGVWDLDSKSIEISTTAPPPEEGVPTIGPGVVLQAAMSLALNPSVIEVYETKTIQSMLKIKNAGSLDLNNVRINISGLQEGWYSIQPDSYDKIIPGDTRTVILMFTPTKAGTYNFNITISSTERSESIEATLKVLELTPEAEQRIEEEEKAEEIRKEIEKRLTIIRPLLIVAGMIAPAIIAFFMIFSLIAERCPLCGSKMKTEYKGKYITGYRCTKCKHFEVKEMRKK